MKFTVAIRLGCFAALPLFCGNAVCGASAFPPESTQAETAAGVVAELERAISALNAGTPLSPEQRERLFPETASSGMPFFFELNFRDRRVRKLRELVLASPQFSEKEKSCFLAMTSESAYHAALESIFSGDDARFVVLPRSAWADEFRKAGPPEAEQKKLLDAYAARLARHELALEAFFGGGDISAFLEEQRAVDRARAEVSALLPPDDAAAEKRLCEYFFMEIAQRERGIQQRKIDFAKKDRSRALLLLRRDGNASEMRVPSYLREYEVLRLASERERRADAAEPRENE